MPGRITLGVLVLQDVFAIIFMAVQSDLQDPSLLHVGAQVFKVGVLAPLDVLEAREAARGDRLIGLARWQVDRVHAGRRYDLEVDSAALTAAQCAERIRDRFGL